MDKNILQKNDVDKNGRFANRPYKEKGASCEKRAFSDWIRECADMGVRAKPVV